MSRSPYRKNVYNNQKRELSPYREETSKLAEVWNQLISEI